MAGDSMYPEQKQLPFLTHYDGPRLLPLADIVTCRTYREAVLLCHLRATRKTLPQLLIANEVNELVKHGHRMRSSHLTEYLSSDVERREMPARFIQAFECVMGNRAITQWQTMHAGLHHVEQYIVEQRQV